MGKTKVLFVGAFKKQGKDGTVGGQLFACQSLVNSSLSDSIDWIKLDTMASTNKQRSLLERSTGALKRMFIFIYKLLTANPKYVLVFASSGFSFIEKGMMIRIAKLFGKKTILAPRSGLIKNDVQSKKIQRYVTKVLASTDILICQGESWKTFYQQYNTNATLQFRVIHNWIDPTEYLNIPRTYKQEIEPLNILFIGWITQNKGVYEIIEAAKKLDNQAVFHLAGDGDAFDEVKNIINENGLSSKVILEGWVKGDAKLKLLEAADVFILPSYREGYPNALIEAMSSGLPCITTPVGSIIDVIDHCENGWLVEVGSDEEIKKAVEFLYENPNKRREIGKMAQQSVMDKNLVEKAVKSFEKIFTL